MDVVALQVLQLLFGVGIAGSFLWAMVPRRSATQATSARHRAEWLSVAFGLVLTYLVLVVVRRATGQGGPDPLGLIPFLTLAPVTVVAGVVLRAVWRRAIAAAIAEHGAAQGVAQPDPPSRHRGLSGDEAPPTRW